MGGTIRGSILKQLQVYGIGHHLITFHAGMQMAAAVRNRQWFRGILRVAPRRVKANQAPNFPLFRTLRGGALTGSTTSLERNRGARLC
jgi:hypothetical protein